MLSPYLILLSFFMIPFCRTLTSLFTLNLVKDVNKSDILPILDNISDEQEFGVLHTLRKYAEWSEKEEKFQIIFTQKLNLLRQERNLIKSLLLTKLCLSNLLKLVHGVLEFQSYQHRIIFNKPVLSIMIDSDKQKWVGSEDLFISMTGIAYLQNIYLIPGEKMITGLPMESKFGGLLSQIDCVIHSLFSLINQKIATAINWLQTAKQYSSTKYGLDWISTITLIGIQIHNSRYEYLSRTNPTIKIKGNESLHDLYNMPILNGQVPPFEYSQKILRFTSRRGLDSNARFTDLCQGNNLQSAEQQAKLYCYFENKKDLYLYINPVKVEQLSSEPPILQFYKIMSKSSMEKIQREVGPHVKSYNLFFDKDNVAQKNSPVRITNSARMGIRNFAKVSNATYYLTGILSGLNIWDHPNHNILGEHVYGRHFNIHNDGLYTKRSSETPEDEDTIATMVFYLKLPKKGGCTAFIHAGVCSRKVTGSAIFWYNMYKNGTYSTQLTHGSCPVYHGNKIAISFFFQHNANWNRRLCSVNQLE